MRKLILVAGFIGILAVAFIVIQPARPNPFPAPAPTPQPATPPIAWSVSQLTANVFPGTNSTITVSFQSDQNLTDIVVDITPSLNGIVSASPANFASITANQQYQLTLILTAPPAFIKRSFGGTIHLRDANPPNTYAPALPVDLETAWNTVSPDGLFTVNLPMEFQIVDTSSSGGYDTHDFLIRLPDGTKVGYIFVYTLQQWADAQQAEEYPTMLSQAGGFVYAFAQSQALRPSQQDLRTEFRIAIGTFQPN
ncbi:MAG TPA: hypothetical protein VGQ49_13440 [Bryobacteraceae bacterium]|jgi:hypothetical protein|nr:hypothetical protein [Bryobacteraceae bacterium]